MTTEDKIVSIVLGAILLALAAYVGFYLTLGIVVVHFLEKLW